MTGVGALGGATGGRCLDGNSRERHHSRSTLLRTLNSATMAIRFILLIYRCQNIQASCAMMHAMQSVSLLPMRGGAPWRDMVEANVTLSQPT